ncbi:MAG: response regulator [Deltaproteobacteria bacterium]|nr:response regulator [Deltaproteobacteria bacterium]
MKKVLLVDDVKLFLELEKTLLANRSNLQLFTATSGQEAIDIHKKEKVDLILCDLYMPGMNGNEVCKIIRSDDNLKKVSIIIVTTSAKDTDMCLAAGANDVVLKPINPTELMKKVGKYINISVRRDIRILARIGVEGLRGAPSESFLGNTVNISMSGVLIETGHAFTVGETVSCSFFIPGNSAPITVTGEVVRRPDSDQPGMNYYGIRFLDIKEEDKLAIAGYINRHPEAAL